jgi:hypothetical protein
MYVGPDIGMSFLDLCISTLNMQMDPELVQFHRALFEPVTVHFSTRQEGTIQHVPVSAEGPESLYFGN